VDLARYTLTVDGAVKYPMIVRHEELLAMHSVTRRIRMDCVGGFRNNTDMRGITFAEVMARAKPLPEARRAIFYCADGYFESSTLDDLAAADAMLAYEVNNERVARLGFPLRLAIPGKYGYKWAKWVQRIEIVTHDRKGYWPQRGLPDRADVGDRW
ncbi:MAG: molybdopterin-dependent oxidoreductase, partial [Chloroflexi bacterium]|nr:molybdopterin-dependent oxidoreductase [Chloroflexota bacterium]